MLPPYPVVPRPQVPSHKSEDRETSSGSDDDGNCLQLSQGLREVVPSDLSLDTVSPFEGSSPYSDPFQFTAALPRKQRLQKVGGVVPAKGSDCVAGGGGGGGKQNRVSPITVRSEVEDCSNSTGSHSPVDKCQSFPTHFLLQGLENGFSDADDEGEGLDDDVALSKRSVSGLRRPCAKQGVSKMVSGSVCIGMPTEGPC